MKKLLPLLSVLFLILGCYQEVPEYDINEVYEKDLIFYHIKTDEPIWGDIYQTLDFGDTTMKSTMGFISKWDNKRIDIFLVYYINGRIIGDTSGVFRSNTKVDGKNKDGIFFETYDKGILKDQNDYSSYLGGKPSKWNSSVQESVLFKKLIEKDGIYFLSELDKPYSGLVHTLYDDGSKETSSTIEDGKPNGIHRVWYKNGQIEVQGSYYNGKEDGLWTSWYRNGKKERERTYWNGKLNGSVTHWYKNGQKEDEGTYWNGKQDGLWIYWYENGKRRYEENFWRGKRDGLYTYWYKNEQKEREGNYWNGKQHGLWTFWYENGVKKSEDMFKNGKIVSY